MSEQQWGDGPVPDDLTVHHQIAATLSASATGGLGGVLVTELSHATGRPSTWLRRELIARLPGQRVSPARSSSSTRTVANELSARSAVRTPDAKACAWSSSCCRRSRHRVSVSSANGAVGHPTQSTPDGQTSSSRRTTWPHSHVTAPLDVREAAARHPQQRPSPSRWLPA